MLLRNFVLLIAATYNLQQSFGEEIPEAPPVKDIESPSKSPDAPEEPKPPSTLGETSNNEPKAPPVKDIEPPSNTDANSLKESKPPSNTKGETSNNESSATKPSSNTSTSAGAPSDSTLYYLFSANNGMYGSKRNNSQIVYTKSISKGAVPGVQHAYPLRIPMPNETSNIKEIHAVEIKDLGEEPGWTRLIGGGYLKDFIFIELKSAFGFGFKFRITIWGEPLSKNARTGRTKAVGA